KFTPVKNFVALPGAEVLRHLIEACARRNREDASEMCRDGVGHSVPPIEPLPLLRECRRRISINQNTGLSMKNNRKGFTLIELLIVVVIIGILAAIAIPKFANTKEKAYLASMKSDLRNMATAEEAFFSDSTYYTTATTLVSRNGFKNSSGVGVPVVVP